MNDPERDGLSRVRLTDQLGPLPERVEIALADLLEAQFALGLMAARTSSASPAQYHPAAVALKKACAAIQMALLDEREQCAKVLRDMWDENAGRHDVCFGPYHDGWTDALDLAERRIVLRPNARVQAGTTAPQPDPERDEAARRGASP